MHHVVVPVDLFVASGLVSVEASGSVGAVILLMEGPAVLGLVVLILHQTIMGRSSPVWSLTDTRRCKLGLPMSVHALLAVSAVLRLDPVLAHLPLVTSRCLLNFLNWFHRLMKRLLDGRSVHI